MLTSLHIQNFKLFRDELLDIRPLTVLTGLNGSGKSTVMQAILLARLATQTEGTRSVPLNGALGLGLGEALDVLTSDAPSSHIRFTFETSTGTVAVVLRVPDDRSLHLSVEQVSGSNPTLSGPPAAFSYLASERLGPREWHEVDAVEPSQLNVGCAGQFTAQVLSWLERKEVREPLLHPQTPAYGGVKTLRAQSELWLSRVVRPVQVEATWLEGVEVATLRFRPPGAALDWMKPANTGYGFSYALPIIVAGLTTEPGGVLLIENPETHLHPAGQSAIGEFLALVSSSGVQVVVETHSDHFINGVRLAVAGDNPLDSSRVRIIFFHQTGHSDLMISRQGAIDSWPTGFFDQIETDLSRLAEARRSTKMTAHD